MIIDKHFEETLEYIEACKELRPESLETEATNA
jgi:hypothetical protein